MYEITDEGKQLYASGIDGNEISNYVDKIIAEGTVKNLSQIFSRTQVSHRRNGDVFYASTSLSIDTSR